MQEVRSRHGHHDNLLRRARGVGDLIRPRANRFQTVHSRASARTGEVYLAVRDSLPIAIRGLNNVRFLSRRLPSRCFQSFLAHMSALELLHTKPKTPFKSHRLPHPPQTPVAHFKRLYRKAPGAKRPITPAIFTPGTSDRVLPFGTSSPYHPLALRTPGIGHPEPQKSTFLGNIESLRESVE